MGPHRDYPIEKSEPGRWVTKYVVFGSAGKRGEVLLEMQNLGPHPRPTESESAI